MVLQIKPLVDTQAKGGSWYLGNCMGAGTTWFQYQWTDEGTNSNGCS